MTPDQTDWRLVRNAKMDSKVSVVRDDEGAFRYSLLSTSEQNASKNQNNCLLQTVIVPQVVSSGYIICNARPSTIMVHSRISSLTSASHPAFERCPNGRNLNL